ncbi:hypothetical protein FOL47_008713 [Perkinsus chesapeaki]|uniref:Uncharacterized protein n=1 Tax=Perkinsus chesapeaki TaxID=330153 RepID=A0A7J6LCE9_PERCH|nr:hypothetical protein FOL47_008713 [Perkinsus chesapeaki]
MRSTKEQPSSSSSSTTVPATANFDNIESEPLDGDELDIESWGLGEEDDLVDVEALAEIMCSTGDAETVGGPKEDLRRQAVKFRGSASLFRELNKKYNCLGITDRSVRIWADFELQRNIESQNYEASPGEALLGFCLLLETSEDGKNVSGGGPVVERADFAVEVRVNDADNTDGEDAEALMIDTAPATRETLWRDTALEIQRRMRLKLLHVTASVGVGVLATTQSHPCIQGHRTYRYCPLTTHPEVNGFMSLEDYKRLILPQNQLKTQARKRAKEEALCNRCGEPLADTHRPLSSKFEQLYSLLVSFTRR